MVECEQVDPGHMAVSTSRERTQKLPGNHLLGREDLPIAAQQAPHTHLGSLRDSFLLRDVVIGPLRY
jgi:hypothetical protein